MAYESRLSITIDSRTAEQRAEDMQKSLELLERAGVRLTNTNSKVSSSSKNAGSAMGEAGSKAKNGASGVDRINKSLKETDSAAASAAATMRRTLIGAFAGISTMQIIDIADQWGQYDTRIKGAIRSTEEYTYVNERLLQSSADTFRSINETKESFINLSPVLRDMGLTLSQSIDAVDAFSGLLVVNGANAERGAAAIQALAKSMQKGKVDADAWITIYSTADTIVDSLAKSTGKSAQELRKLGAEGKITGAELAKALAEDYGRIIEQVEKMPTTVRDAFTKMNNTISEYVGQQNKVYGITAKMVDGINGLSNNFDTLVTMVGVTAVAAFSRYAGVLTSNTIETIRNAVSKERERKAAVAAAEAELRLATAKRASVMTAGQAIVADQRLAAARKQLEVATNQATFATRAFNGAMSLVGGPAGLVFMGAAALTYWASSAQDSEAKTAGLGREVDALLGRMDELRKKQLSDAIDDQTKAVEALRKKVLDVRYERITDIDSVGDYVSGVLAAGKRLLSSTEENRAAERKAASERAEEYVELSQQLQKAEDDLQKLKDALAGVDSEGSGVNIGEQTKKMNRLLERLNDEYASLTLNKEALAAYNVEKLKAQIATSNLSDAEKREAESLVDEIQRRKQAKDALEKQEEAQRNYITLMESLRTDNERLNDTFKKQIEILNAAGLSADQYSNALRKISQSTVSQAPMFGGIDAAIGGASGELFKVALASQELQAWRSNELNKQREYYEQGLIDAQLYANNVVNINQQMLQRQTDLQDSWRSATLSTFSSVTGDAAEMLRGLGDESSGIYKAMFIASKAAAIAQAWINTELAATRAIAELGPIAGPPMAQFVRGIGYASIGIMSATAMQGFKTGGYTGSVGVNDVAGLVHGREFVFDHQATSRIGVDNLEALRTGRLASDDLARRVNSDFKRAAADGVMQTVQITNNIYPQSTETTSSGMQDNESQKMIKRINEMQAAATRKVLLEELRPMGLLDPNRRR
ncbi:tape measure protein [Shewanella algae]|uniref:tape measure protein n=1 Tax=Shewanella algae TaxID=38313 RepID=UPI001AADEEF5|nr:tape measure protein [Shewanella algae]MBO2552586.1 tape measure protein [Shewanella algae]